MAALSGLKSLAIRTTRGGTTRRLIALPVTKDCCASARP